MKFGKTILALSLFFVASTTPQAREPYRTNCDAGCITPSQAILLAAQGADFKPQKGVSGVFELMIQATGASRMREFLNSETDYRDQRNLTIALDPEVVDALKKEHGVNPAIYFKGKTIRVDGIASRIRIDFTSNRQATGKYYYQTHVRVKDPNQITVVALSTAP
ncbi:MAG: hypothetical protein ABL918_04085 [Chakrabartia sp.]